MDALEWIRTTHPDVLERPGGFVHFGCKVCGEKAGRSAWMSIESGWVKCYQPSCPLSVKGLYIDQYKRLAMGDDGVRLTLDRDMADAYRKRREERTVPKVDMPASFTPAHLGDGMFAEQARAYLRGRGLEPEELWRRYMVAWVADGGEWHGRIVIPWLHHGQVAWVQGRDFTGMQQRWHNPGQSAKDGLVYNSKAIGTRRDLHVFEGVFNVYALGADAVALGGSSLSTKQAALLSGHRGRLMVAMDEGAWLKTLEHCAVLSQTHPDVWAVPVEGEGGDASAMGKDAYMRCAGEAVRIGSPGEATVLMHQAVMREGKSYPLRMQETGISTLW